MKKTLAAVVLTALCFGAYAFAQQVVNQGKPGTQGPWPVTCISGCSGGSGGGGGGSFTTDGGFLGLVAPAQCRRYPQSNTTVGTSAVIIPASGLSTRLYIDVCNSVLNASTAICVCAAESVPAGVTATAVGDVLQAGDCARYPTPYDAGSPRCICNQAGVAILGAECSVI